MKKRTTEENISALEKLFPECVEEENDGGGKVKKKVNFERLHKLLTEEEAEEEEAYAFTWAGKREAAAEAGRPAGKRLTLCREESRNPDETENLYIEGDNLDALKVLLKDGRNAVKVMYIDPPYNTGNDFIYRDNFTRPVSRKGRGTEQKHLFKNTEQNGRFHSDWCSMMYSRLLLARELLSEDGVIFLSIDDHEQANLKKICDEVFGEANFLAQIIWERAYSPVNLKKHFSECHDYILCYAKNIQKAVCRGLPRSREADRRYINPDHDPRGPWKPGDLSVGPIVESKVYEITTPGGRKVFPPSGYCWRLDRETFDRYVADNRIWFGADGNNVPAIKRFLSEVKQGITPMTIWKYTEVGHSQDATKRLKELFGDKAYFNYPKPVELVKRCIRLYSDPDCTVMDFFSGSATTAQAVMELNAEDGGKRRYILVQLPEECKKRSAAYQDGFRTICDIGKERIRLSADRIREENPDKDLDLGFRVLRLEETEEV